jgi:hypothetical protein
MTTSDSAKLLYIPHAPLGTSRRFDQGLTNLFSQASRAY